MWFENIDISYSQESSNVLEAEIEYPKSNKIDSIEIGLTDVRAADNIRITYDYDRNGWVILQPRDYYSKLTDGSPNLETEWIESAFCKAWEYELKNGEEFNYNPENEKVCEKYLLKNTVNTGYLDANSQTSHIKTCILIEN